jgi:hypothetical protein
MFSFPFIPSNNFMRTNQTRRKRDYSIRIMQRHHGTASFSRRATKERRPSFRRDRLHHSMMLLLWDSFFVLF